MCPEMTQNFNGMETFQKQLLVSDAGSNKENKNDKWPPNLVQSVSKQSCWQSKNSGRLLLLFCFCPVAANDRLSRDRGQEDTMAGTD